MDHPVCTFHLLARQQTDTIGDSGFCCCISCNICQAPVIHFFKFYSLVDFAYFCKFYQISAITNRLISFFLILFFHFSFTWKPWTQNSGPHWFSSLLQKVLSFRADISLVGFMYLIFTCMPGGSYHKWSRSLVLHFLECMWYLSSTINSLC